MMVRIGALMQGLRLTRLPNGTGVWLPALAAGVVLISCGASEEPGAAGVAGKGAETQGDAGLSGITTYAGTGSPIFDGDGGPASEAGFYAPTGVAVDAEGNLYISTDNRIRKVDAATGIITTFAGTGRAASEGDGGAAADAALFRPMGITIDGAGTMFVTENSSGLIRRIDAATGIVTTVAGGGVGNPRLREVGDGGPATDALIRLPADVAVDGEGNLYVAAINRVRRVDEATGIITTFAGTGERGVEGDGGPATEAGLAEPIALAIDRLGNLYIADRENHRVRKVDAATGIITTVAGVGKHDQRAILYYTEPGRYAPRVAAAGGGYSGDGGPGAEARLTFPASVAVGPDGTVYIAEGGVRVRKVDATTGTITTVWAGETESSLESGRVQIRTTTVGEIVSLAVNAQGEIFLADSRNNLVHQVSAPAGAP